MTAPDKLIVSNGARLIQKYGETGAKAVTNAVTKLIEKDATRGIISLYVDLSDAATMASRGAPVISTEEAADARLNKEAIDKVFTSFDIPPAYLMILGSTDVIPHVPLDNPMAGDGDADLPSDLPYACDAAYSTDVQDFIAPTRVVGRLPNVTNDTKSSYLVGLLTNARNYSSRPATAYNGFLGITAQVWKKSTELSLDGVFGGHAGLKVSPPNGYKWTTAVAKRLAHFVNCHGAAADPHFYGQKGASYPVAHSAEWMSKKVAKGTVMAAECCYGAELYDPALPTAGGQMSMCNTYLSRKGYAYLGSTNIAYGPPASNDQADLMCQYFLREILGGASAGRACLQARLEYINGKAGVLAPTDLKTLGQFTLMGDPSLTPVSAEPEMTILSALPGAKKLEAATEAVARHGRIQRRMALEARAAMTTAYRLKAPEAPPRGGKTGAFGKLRKLAAEHGIKKPDVLLSYDVGTREVPPGAKAFLPMEAMATVGPKAVHALLERLESPPELPHLALIRGMQAIEYADGMVAQVFESR